MKKSILIMAALMSLMSAQVWARTCTDQNDARIKQQERKDADVDKGKAAQSRPADAADCKDTEKLVAGKCVAK